MRTDLISRCKLFNRLATLPAPAEANTFKAEVYKIIQEMETEDRPRGEWIPFEYGDERWHKCTACGVADKYIEYVERPNGTTGKLVAIRNYCPNCGADMQRRDNDN